MKTKLILLFAILAIISSCGTENDIPSYYFNESLILD